MFGDDRSGLARSEALGTTIGLSDPPRAGGSVTGRSGAELSGGRATDRSADAELVSRWFAFETGADAGGRSRAFAGGMRVASASLGFGAVAVRPAGAGVPTGVTSRVRSSAICNSTESPIASAMTVATTPSARVANTRSLERDRPGGGGEMVGAGGRMVDGGGRVVDGGGGAVERGAEARDGGFAGGGVGRFHSPGGTLICGPRLPPPRSVSR